MINDQTVEDIGNAVKAIRERGWVQGMFEDHKGAVCLVGALKAAIYGSAYDWNVLDEITLDQRNRYYDAYYLVYHVADRKPEHFNDDKKTKRRHVFKVLKEAQRQATKDV